MRGSESGARNEVRPPKSGHRQAGIVTETEGPARGVNYRHGSALLPPTSLPAAGHPARDLALSPIHTELPGRGVATGRARPAGYLSDRAALGSEARAPGSRARCA